MTSSTVRSSTRVTRRRQGRRAVHRPRRLQDRQRHDGSRGRRRAARGSCPSYRSRASASSVPPPASVATSSRCCCPTSRNDSDVRAVADRILVALGDPVAIDGQIGARAGVSIGIASHVGAADAAELMQHADVAMYTAKRNGKGRFDEFEPNMSLTVARRHQLKVGLERAIANDEFVLHYQPVIDVGSGAISGTEALLRWKDPERGLMPPVGIRRRRRGDRAHRGDRPYRVARGVPASRRVVVRSSPEPASVRQPLDPPALVTPTSSTTCAPRTPTRVLRLRSSCSK